MSAAREWWGFRKSVRAPVWAATVWVATVWSAIWGAISEPLRGVQRSPVGTTSSASYLQEFLTTRASSNQIRRESQAQRQPCKKQRLQALVLLSLSLCQSLLFSACFTFERAADVIDPRILAIQAEPPELLLLGVPPPVELQALVVDPEKPERTVNYEWRTCLPDLKGIDLGELADLGDGDLKTYGDLGDLSALAGSGQDLSNTTDEGRCDESVEATLVSKGKAPLSQLGATFVPPAELALLAAARSIPGLSFHLQVQLRVDFPSGPLYAQKRLVVTIPPDMNYRPNQNPRISALLFDGALWEAGEALEMRMGTCPDANIEEFIDLADPTEIQNRCGYRVSPVFDEHDAENYVVSSFAGEEIHLKERLRFDWFSTHAQFSAINTSQPYELGPQSYDPITNVLFEPAEGGQATIWVVIRDGRGGLSWQQRTVIFKE